MLQSRWEGAYNETRSYQLQQMDVEQLYRLVKIQVSVEKKELSCICMICHSREVVPPLGVSTGPNRQEQRHFKCETHIFMHISEEGKFSKEGVKVFGYLFIPVPPASTSPRCTQWLHPAWRQPAGHEVFDSLKCPCRFLRSGKKPKFNCDRSTTLEHLHR